MSDKQTLNREGLQRHRNRGVTLIELMIVVVIVGILTAIAYPSYTQYVLRAKRSEAKALLADVASRMERYYFDNNTYTTDLTQVGYNVANPPSAEGHYTAASIAGIDGAGTIATSYTLRVTTVGYTDAQCGYLEQTSKGDHRSELGTPATCWN